MQKMLDLPKDQNGKIINIGDVVVCLDPIEDFIALNGLYTVVDVLIDSGRIAIKPDLTGRLGHYNASRFKIVDLTNL